ncbi:hypothetical protein ACFWPX_05380 [Nocardia sp. NPDC058518]|uniref:hypothetical protein n=1 Tax=Nocardia sp. NPDC058518 TaxID=3346534 RepID=UPI00365D08C8
MTTLLFVHGTGVRQPSYDTRLADVRAVMSTLRPDWSVQPCYWAGAHGATLNAGGASIPGADVVSLDPKLALWWALSHDPLFELRKLAGQPEPRRAPGEFPETAELLDAAAALPTPDLLAAASEAGMSEVLPDAVRDVITDHLCTEALDRVSGGYSAGAAVLARAVVATAATMATDATPLSGDERDLLITAVIAALDGEDRGLLADSTRLLVDLAMRAGGSRWIEKNRAEWTNSASPAAGDVLKYLVRGAGIRGCIADAIQRIDNGPVVILAHSLGGIASLELLVHQHIPQVEHLITVGSQAPFLYEIDALPALAFGDTLPPHVPRWSNILDRRDLLAYRASGVFPGRVTDYEVDNRAPFPTAHSAYFSRKNTRFHELMDAVLR